MSSKESEVNVDNQDDIDSSDAVTQEEISLDFAALSQKLQEAQAKADDNWQAVLRAKAELENVRRGAQRDVEKAHKFALERFCQELLPVKDSLEMGIQAAQSEGADVATIREGTELTLKMLIDVMNKFDIEEVDPQGEAFNPELHQAMSMQESAEHEANTVLAVMQKGYTLNDRLIRPAMVVVSKAPE